MEAETVFEQAALFEVSEAGDGFIIYDEPRDRVHFLNPTATLIYELCQGGRTLAELTECLDESFALEASSQNEVLGLPSDARSGTLGAQAAVILARTLRRDVVLHGPLAETYVDFLRANPTVPNRATHTSEIEISSRIDGLFAMSCTWGRRLTGSARALAVALDWDMMRLSARDEGAVPHLPGSILRVHGHRVMLVGGTGVSLDGLIVALLAQGAAFEGGGLVFLSGGRAVAHPLKPRLSKHQIEALQMSRVSYEAPMLVFHHDQPKWAIDPTFAGTEWRLFEDAIRVVVFTESNEGGRAALSPLRPGDARSRLMRTIVFQQKPTILDLVQLAGVISNVTTLRVVIGDIWAAAALLERRIASDRN